MAAVENVIVGASAVFVGPKGSAAFPVGAYPAGAPTTAEDWRTLADLDTAQADVDTALGTGWRNVGLTQEGVEISYEPDYGDVEVDQLLDSARIFKQSMRITATTTLAEATLENLLVSWGRPDGDLAGGVLNIEGGALGEAPLERGLLVVGNSEEVDGLYGVRVYRIYRALVSDTTAHAMRRNEPTVFACSFRCLPEGTGRYGTVTDVAPA